MHDARRVWTLVARESGHRALRRDAAQALGEGARLAARLGDHAASIRGLVAALQHEPGNAQYYRQIARVQIARAALAQGATAERHLRLGLTALYRANERDARPDVWRLIGNLHARLGEPQDAQAALAHAERAATPRRGVPPPFGRPGAADLAQPRPPRPAVTRPGPRRTETPAADGACVALEAELRTLVDGCIAALTA